MAAYSIDLRLRVLRDADAGLSSDELAEKYSLSRVRRPAEAAAPSVRQAPFAAVSRLDGSTVSVEAPAGITETGAARFEGAALVIASRRSFSSPAGDTVAEFRETWVVSGNVLTVKKTVTQDGESQAASAAYDRASGLNK